MEILLVFIEFHFIKKWKHFLFFILLLSSLGLCIYYCSDDCIYISNTKEFHSNIINVLGILIGFSISVLAILLSVENDNIKSAKKNYIKGTKGKEKKFYSRPISIYECITIELAYIILIQCFLLIANFIYPTFIDITSKTGKLYYSINVSILVYCILLLVQNVLNIYFILTKKEKL